MKHSSRIKWLIIALFVLLISAGCSLGGNKESQPIDPPRDTASIGDDIWKDFLGDDVIQASAEAKIHFSLYVKDPDGFVVPVKMNFPDTEGPAKEVLRYMVQGGPGEKMLPSGFTGLIPQGTEVLGMHIDEGLAIVDFSKQFNEYKAEDERKLLESITWTLTGFPSINEVLIRVDGRTIKEMPVNKTPLDRPLSRTMGINLENPNGVRPTAAMPVTVYFQNENSEHHTYLVPVTRLVEKTDDKTKALLNELIAGPSVTSGLEPVIQPSVEVITVVESEGLITINFSEEFAGANQVVTQEAIETVVLSLTDNTAPDTQVQILIDGNSSLQVGSNQSQSTPVSRPVHINEFSF